MTPRLTFLALLLFAACGTYVKATAINPSPRRLSPRPPEAVAVFASAPPERPHVDYAIIECEQTHSLNEQGTDLMIAKIREVAGAMGCDAVYLGSVADHQGADARNGLRVLDPPSTIRQAVCIVYTPSEEGDARAAR